MEIKILERAKSDGSIFRESIKISSCHLFKETKETENAALPDKGLIDPFLRPPICVLLISVPLSVIFSFYWHWFEAFQKWSVIRKKTVITLAIMNLVISFIGAIWLVMSNFERKKYVPTKIDRSLEISQEV